MTARPSCPFPACRPRACPTADGPQNRKEFTSDQEVRWCPGCGDYAVLAAVQGFLPDLGLKRENIVFVSGHRLLVAVPLLPRHLRHALDPRPGPGDRDRARDQPRSDLSVWVVTGDGDALSIGGNHLIHALRRNVNLTILLFNNRIYGLTKGQYSPTSEPGKVTKSTPMGSVDNPFNPVSLALGAEATFVARTLDSDRKHLTEVLSAAAAHRGTALVEIYQNCPIFNDGAFDVLKDNDTKADAIIPLRARRADPVRQPRPAGVVRDPAPAASRSSSDPDDAATCWCTTRTPRTRPRRSRSRGSPTRATSPTRRSASSGRSRPDVRRPGARPDRAPPAQGTGDAAGALAGLLAGGDTWTVV